MNPLKLVVAVPILVVVALLMAVIMLALVLVFLLLSLAWMMFQPLKRSSPDEFQEDGWWYRE